MIISVIIPAYNSEETIARSLESIRRQTWPSIEIIVVDDGSNDKTEEITRQYPEVKYLCQENRGPASARNNGARAAKGDYLAFLDSDDYWEADHLSNLATLLENNPDFRWAATAYRKRLLKGKEMNVRLPDRFCSRGNVVDYFSATPYLHFLSVISTVVSRDLFLTVGGFAENYRRGEDLSLWLRLALAEPLLAYSQDATAVYVETARSLTGRKGDLSSLVQRITDDWSEVCRHSPELIERAWPVVKPWVTGVMIKSIRTGDKDALTTVTAVFNDRLNLWQRTAIRLCTRQKR